MAAEIPIVKTIATQRQGIVELARHIGEERKKGLVSGKRYRLLAEQAWQLIQQQRMQGVDRKSLAEKIEALLKNGDFNLYRFVREFII